MKGRRGKGKGTGRAKARRAGIKANTERAMFRAGTCIRRTRTCGESTLPAPASRRAKRSPALTVGASSTRAMLEMGCVLHGVWPLEPLCICVVCLLRCNRRRTRRLAMAGCGLAQPVYLELPVGWCRHCNAAISKQSVSSSGVRGGRVPMPIRATSSLVACCLRSKPGVRTVSLFCAVSQHLVRRNPRFL
ncbi:hypothetical protein T440DRAFT_46545 [Plenodomus tracheiphilus IPT5]|uniref:Uncharacterized protein n=1 Tax=Plenodomus tracheiphilus IPT5 TaxID=1408161 RepID=A0A6A7B947_9PLEO|nr:hypothetical protein T440DRAFT_46545 [Plenodomus tracheiphilus IPT5]